MGVDKIKETEPLAKRIHVMTDADLDWSFENGNSRAKYRLNTPNQNWGYTCYVDPFPCYSMDRDLVECIAEQVERNFPVPFKPSYFILAHEFDDRCNGMASYNHIYLDGADRPMPIDPIIVFSGKRIPIHPGMQRYLIAHEYGHVVDYNITYMRKEEINAMDEEYAKMRGLSLDQKMGGRKWHTNIGEIMVNDFRVLFGNFEPEFWPHPVDHPNNSAVVKKFWDEMHAKYAKDTFPPWMDKDEKK